MSRRSIKLIDSPKDSIHYHIMMGGSEIICLKNDPRIVDEIYTLGGIRCLIEMMPDNHYASEIIRGMKMDIVPLLLETLNDSGVSNEILEAVLALFNEMRIKIAKEYVITTNLSNELVNDAQNSA